MEYHEGDLVLCTVDKVENTICFVHLPDGTKGTIISSEIAPGRIKFMRAYVVPNKKIACKVLRIAGDHIDLSLRRVNTKEKKQVMQEYKQQLANKAAFKQILGGDYTKIKEKILKSYDGLLEFIERAREDPSIIDKNVPEQYREQIHKITPKKKKTVEVKFNISVKSFADDGVNKIKELFNLSDENIKVTYISAGKFKLKLTANDFKEGKQKLQKMFDEMEEKAKSFHTEIEYKEEKS